MKYTHYIRRGCYEMLTSKETTYLAVGFGNGAAIYNFATAEKIVDIRLQSGPQKMCFSADEQYLAFIYYLGKIRVYECAAGKEVARGNITKEEPSCMFFSDDGRYVYSMSNHGVLSKYDWKAGKNEILVELKKMSPWDRKQCTQEDFEKIWELLTKHPPFGMEFDKEERREDFFKPACFVQYVYEKEDREYVFHTAEKIVRWKYPFHAGGYTLEDPDREAPRDIRIFYSIRKGYAAALIDHFTSKIEIYDREKKLVYALPELSGTWIPEMKTKDPGYSINYDKFAMNWSPDGNYLAVTISKCDTKTYTETRVAKIYRSSDWEIVREYELLGISFVGFSEDSNYFLLGTSCKGGYCISMKDVISGELE